MYTNSEDELGEALDMQVDKQMALKAMEGAKPAGRRAEHPPQAFMQEQSHHVPDEKQRKEVNDRSVRMSW